MGPPRKHAAALVEAELVAVLLPPPRRRAQTHTTHDVLMRNRYTVQHILDDIDGRWRDVEGTFAGRLAAADPKTASLCSRLFNECFGGAPPPLVLL